MTIKVLALDLERTLITNCINHRPRPGLYEFLAFCLESFEKVVIFTGVDNGTAREVLQELADKGEIPQEFPRRAKVLDWSGEYKDLKFVPGASIEEILIVDDDESYILADQKSQWIPIQPYDPPGINPWLPMDAQEEPAEEDADQALLETQRLLQERLSQE
jgi:hypothetical protein